MRSINLLLTDLKEFLSNEVNRVFLAIIIIGTILIAIGLNNNLAIEQSNKEIITQLKEVNKKVDFRYFNTTRSLEDIHNIKIDTRSGEIKYKH